MGCGEPPCPTCKGFLAAGDDDGPHLWIILHGLQCPLQLLHKPLAEGIESLRPVQLDQAHILLRPCLLYCQVMELGPCPWFRQATSCLEPAEIPPSYAAAAVPVLF